MKPSSLRSWSPFFRPQYLAALLAAVGGLIVSPASLATFEAGISVRIVTPDPLLPVAGGLGPSKPVQKKEGDLTVRALVIKDATHQVAIVSTDFLGYPGVLAERVRQKVKEIPGRNILIGATHTHSAPDIYGFADHEGKFATDLAYVDRVVSETAQAITEAFKNCKPAGLRVATGAARGKIAYNYYAEELYDPRCHIIQFVQADGAILATLVNYAIHPEVLGSGAGILSPDLVGPLYERITELGGGTGIFMNSALGGMVTADNRDAAGRSLNQWEECRRIGRLLADEAMRIVKEAPLIKSPTLFCGHRQVRLPVDSPLIRAVMQASPLRYPTNDPGGITTTVNLVNVGPAQILTIPGEALPNIGYYLKRKMAGEHNLLFGLTNDAFGYIMTRVDWGSFKRYDYITRTCLGEMTGEILIDESLRLVAECPKPTPATLPASKP
jgi:hypothetical protein